MLFWGDAFGPITVIAAVLQCHYRSAPLKASEKGPHTDTHTHCGGSN